MKVEGGRKGVWDYAERSEGCSGGEEEVLASRTGTEAGKGTTRAARQQEVTVSRLVSSEARQGGDAAGSRWCHAGDDKGSEAYGNEWRLLPGARREKHRNDEV